MLKLVMMKNVKLKMMGTIVVALIVAVTGYNAIPSYNKSSLSELVLANIEALASPDETSETIHTLSCGTPGVKMCEGTCGRCNVTLKNWGNGKTATLTCSRD